VSIMSKLKSMPTSYWVAGLGAAALGVDYLIEGEGSIVSSIWRGVTGGGREAERPGPAAPAAQALPPQLTAPPARWTRQQIGPSTTVAPPGFEYLAVPYYGHHRHRRYYPAHEPHHVRERRFRNWPRRGYLPHPGQEDHRPHPDHEDRRFHAGHFDWEA
jgi:hypothetical protein